MKLPLLILTSIILLSQACTKKSTTAPKPVEQKVIIQDVKDPQIETINSSPEKTKEVPAKKPTEEVPAKKPIEEVPAKKPIEEVPAKKPIEEVQAKKPTEEIPAQAQKSKEEIAAQKAKDDLNAKNKAIFLKNANLLANILSGKTRIHRDDIKCLIKGDNNYQRCNKVINEIILNNIEDFAAEDSLQQITAISITSSTKSSFSKNTLTIAENEKSLSQALKPKVEQKQLTAEEQKDLFLKSFTQVDAKSKKFINQKIGKIASRFICQNKYSFEGLILSKSNTKVGIYLNKETSICRITIAVAKNEQNSLLGILRTAIDKFKKERQSDDLLSDSYLIDIK